MRRLVEALPLAIVGCGAAAIAVASTLAGCSRKTAAVSGSSSARDAAAAVDAWLPTAQAPTPLSEPVFSSPIAAAVVGQARFVAGLVVADKVLRVRATRGDSVLWTTDVVHGAAWAPDVALELVPAADGVAVLWGAPGARGVRSMVVLGPHGDPQGEPAEIGAAACPTADGIAWVEPHRTGPVKIRARRWSDGAVHVSATLPPDRDPSLVCGDHAVYVLGDGDDDLTVTAFVPGETDSAPPRVAMRDADFGDDEEREHEPYTFGDVLGLVRVGSSGALSLRDIPRAGAPGPWRALKHKLAADDEVVAVDGDASATLVVFTHDAEDTCAGVGSNAVAVHAIRVDRANGAESLLDLAAPDCDVSPGPFWVAAAPGGEQVVAWVERSGKVAPGGAPIRRLSVRALRADGIRASGVALSADAVADGSCADGGCFAAALVRGPDGDAMHPESIAAIAYP